MGYFPFFVELEGTKGLIVGGGKIAAHKVKKMLPYGADLIVVAQEIGVELQEILEQEEVQHPAEVGRQITVIHRAFQDEDVKDKAFVIAATDDEVCNAHISQLCREQNILVNVVDDKEKCGFLFPSLIQAGQLSIGISTAGASPWIASKIRTEVDSKLPDNMNEILNFLQDMRLVAKSEIEGGKNRASFLKQLADVAMEKGRPLSDGELSEVLQSYTNQDSVKQGQRKNTGAGSVSVIVVSAGKRDNLTLKGLQEIRRADVLLYDSNIEKEVLEYASEACVRKNVERLVKNQEEEKDIQIASVMQQYAFDEKNVIYLTSNSAYNKNNLVIERVCQEAQLDYMTVYGVSAL